jgi:cation:H+ antiporter
MTIVLFVAGLVLLLAGGELLVRGASSLATAVGISPLVVGLTVVALGTSAPELAVSVRASLVGHGDLAAGNVIGSNIFNVLFILGISAVVRPLAVSARLVRFDVPIMIAAALLMWALCQDRVVSRVDGAILLCGIVTYTTYLIAQSRRETRAFRRQVEARVEEKRVVAPAVAATDDPSSSSAASSSWRSPVPLQLVLIAAGLVALEFGTYFLINAAVRAAAAMGVSELVIGLTIISVGPSLPEVAASVIATARGHRDMAVGNVIGSNIFNTLCIPGGAAVARPVPVPASALAFDLPVMVVVSLAALPVLFRGGGIARWEGALFVGYYVAYTAYLILDAVKHDALSRYGFVMFWFVIPITLATVLALAINDFRGRRRSTLSPLPRE